MARGIASWLSAQWVARAASRLDRARLQVESCFAAAISDFCFSPISGDGGGSGIPREWVLLDQQPRRIRWQVAYTEQARWCTLSSAAFFLPLEQVAGGLIPHWPIERLEFLHRDWGAQCS